MSRSIKGSKDLPSVRDALAVVKIMSGTSALKTLKRSVLPFFGLCTLQSIIGGLDSYSAKNVNKGFAKVEEEYKKQQPGQLLSPYAIALLPIDRHFHVEVNTIRSLDDLYALKKNFASRDLNDISEITFDRKTIDPNVRNIIGRINISAFNDNRIDVQRDDGQLVDIAWGCSDPRDMDIALKGSEYACLHAERMTWGEHYRISTSYIPESNPMGKNELLEDFAQIAVLLEGYKEKIQFFAEYIWKLGIPELSLEFSATGGKIRFYDWDTNNDIKIINSLIENKRIDADLMRVRPR